MKKSILIVLGVAAFTFSAQAQSVLKINVLDK